MPTCPGCGAAVGYGELREHVGTCRFVWSEKPRRTDRLSQHLADKVARLERRLASLDADESEPPSETDQRDGPDRERQRLR